MKDGTVHIIIVHYNNPRDTYECIEHIEKQSKSNWKVFIIDNGSHEDAFLQLYDRLKLIDHFRFFNIIHFQDNEEHEYGKVNLIRSEENKGYGGAVNIVLQKSMDVDGYCLLLNPDVLLEEEAIRNLIDCAKSEPESILGCKMLDENDQQKTKYLGGFRVRLWSGTIRFVRENEELQRLDAISGGCLFTANENIRKIGMFPEHYFLYWEDADWCRKARQMGVPLKVCNKAIAYDKGSTTIGQGYLSEYYYTLNALRFLEWEGRRYQFTTLASNLGRAFKRLLQFRFPNFRAILTASFHYLTQRGTTQSNKTIKGQ